MAISPIAHVALLQTEINSGFKFLPRIGMKSPAIGKGTFQQMVRLTQRKSNPLSLTRNGRYIHLSLLTNKRFDMLETGFSQIS